MIKQNKCAICQKPFTHSVKLLELINFQPFLFNQCCQPCYQEFLKIDLSKKHCPYCLKQLDKTQLICSDCLRWKKENKNKFVYHTSLFYYTDSMSTFFSHYKFEGNLELAKVFAWDLFSYLKPLLKEYTLVPIPLAPNTFQQRGFNQVIELLSSGGLSYDNYLIKTKETISQTKKSKKERLSLEQPFLWNPIYRKVENKKKIILVDDIYTTGKTIACARQCLLNKGFKNIRSFSLAR